MAAAAEVLVAAAKSLPGPQQPRLWVVTAMEAATAEVLAAAAEVVAVAAKVMAAGELWLWRLLPRLL